MFLQRESVGNTSPAFPFPETVDQPQSAPGVSGPWFAVIVQRIGNVFALDVRSLALFRVCLSLILLTDLCWRAFNLRAHYTDVGVFPRGVALSQFLDEWYFSIHLMTGTLLGQSLLFSLNAACAVSLLVGYRTTLATCLSWFFMISLHNRNLMILDSGDVVLQMLLFWSMFLPLGAAYSVDAARKPTPQRREVSVRSIGSVALLLQICFIYWFTAALKTDPIWRQEGSGVYYALNLDVFATHVGVWLRQFPQAMTAISFSTLKLETFGPWLLFLPIAQGQVRCLAIALFVGFHIGIGLCLDLGIFPFIMLTTWLILVPTWLWEKFAVPCEFSAQRTQQIRRWLKHVGLCARFRVAQTGRWQWWWSVMSASFCTACLLYVFLWNLRTTDFAKYSQYLPQKYNWIGNALRIDQMWNMFAPKPLQDDGWYVIPAHLHGGKEVDLMTEQASVTWEKPAFVLPLYRDQRWRKYLLNLWEREHAAHRLYFGRYLCRNWNATHQGDETLETFEIYFMKETTLPNGKVAPIEKVNLWNHNCFG